MHISLFLKTNDKGKVKDTTLWETFKVYMIGQIISYEAIQKKQREPDWQKLREN